jgi:hypothetical protein
MFHWRKIMKRLLTAAMIVISSSAISSELPQSRKQTQTDQYVKVCSAYGEGFFVVPGTDSCIRVGGRVRADFGYVAPQAIYGNPGSTAGNNPIGTSKEASQVWGTEARGRISIDHRTPTEWGTVQSVMQLRLSRASGVIDKAGPDSFGSKSVSTQLERAYIRFAGFTFGQAQDNFTFMPSITYGAQYWASFANGARQISYTALLGNGLSVTAALQNSSDTEQTPTNLSGLTSANEPKSSFNRMPNFVGNVNLDQSWGEVQISGAVGRQGAVNSLATYDKETTVWAIGSGLKIELPMLGKKDAIWFTGAYADGMTEYATNWGSVKTTSWARNIGGYVTAFPGVVIGPSGIETTKSWSVGTQAQHYWTPTVASSVFASYGSVKGTETSEATTRANGGFGDAKMWSVGKQVAWFPTKNFEIGAEVNYANLSQDIRRTSSLKTRESEGNWTGLLRVERNF